MIERPLDQITLDDIEALVTFQRSESRTLDFKEAFPSGDHKGVRDFLADVTAFANTDGGDIVIGVREDKNGVAAEVAGIGRTGLDQELRRIDDQLRSLVDPSVPSFKVRELQRPDGKSVLVIRVGASLIAPHRVAHDKSSRFYRRANRSNFEMSTTEIRQAFAASRDFPDRIRDLHHKAVAAIRGADMPTRIVAGPTLVVTIAPLSVLREARDIRVTRDYAVLPPDPSGGIHYVVGLEGLIVLVDLDQAQGARVVVGQPSTWLRRSGVGDREQVPGQGPRVPEEGRRLPARRRDQRHRTAASARDRRSLDCHGQRGRRPRFSDGAGRRLSGWPGVAQFGLPR
ncbi:AlbA family DNA-binding domain-containing protein [Caulobacter sp. AP07]|uniref:AlbA family DNA-binding domain-containing protein n=1 Tax=Caulobacter sp. AP07 TaxID=1144304 RepID=UPI0009DACF23|nr:ATP-binding protein [Caulobacter sp. AP07]